MAADAGKRETIELVSWALLAAATVGSAWCAYQSALWNGEQTRDLASASIAQFGSLRKTSIVNRNVNIDVGTFINFIEADIHGDRKVSQFLREHARPEFKPALEAWIADNGLQHPAVTNPFLRPEYRSAADEEAQALDGRALSFLTAANRANGVSDHYVLHTVLFALSLFFLGATGEARQRAMRRTMLVFGALAFMLTVISMSRLPRASPRRADQTAPAVLPTSSSPKPSVPER